jgi:hypothetical protein
MKRMWLIMGVVLAVGLIVVGIMLLAPKPPIPGPIKKQVTSTLIVPQLADVTIDRQSVKYDDKLKLLSYTADVYGISTVISEQPTPDSFTDIPQVYDKVTASMNEYSKFDTDIGTVHITRPKELDGKQAAVLNTKGTLLFAKPERDLSDEQWRKFFGSFEVEK